MCESKYTPIFDQRALTIDELNRMEQNKISRCFKETYTKHWHERNGCNTIMLLYLLLRLFQKWIKQCDKIMYNCGFGD